MRKDPPKSASPIWKAIKAVKKSSLKVPTTLLEMELLFNVWLDPWVPWIQDFTPKPLKASFVEPPLMVSMLFDTETHRWKEDLIQCIFEPPSVQAILSLLIPTRPSEDKLIWVSDSRGEFSVKSAYRISSQQVTSSNLSEVLWKKAMEN